MRSTRLSRGETGSQLWYHCDRRANLAPVTTATLRTLRVGRSTTRSSSPTSVTPACIWRAVIISIHVLGQTALGFRVSVPQILSAILTSCGDRGGVDASSHRSTGVAGQRHAHRQRRRPDLPGARYRAGRSLELARAGTSSRWSPACLLLTKYVIRYRGFSRVQPVERRVGRWLSCFSGARRVEPLDFWWAPLDGWMVRAYVIILVGGLLDHRPIASPGDGGDVLVWAGVRTRPGGSLRDIA